MAGYLPISGRACVAALALGGILAVGISVAIPPNGPPRVLPVHAAATDRLGWPHRPSPAERREAQAVVWSLAANRDGRARSATCRSATRNVGVWRCSVNPQTVRRNTRRALLEVSEDGTWTIGWLVQP
jgi:hypothetical protein